MRTFGEFFQTADWKKEKHVPVIDCPEHVKAGEMFTVKVTVGKEAPHPNVSKSGIMFASGFCNIHGLWSSEKTLELSQ